MKDITLPYRFEPRDYQLPVLDALDSGKRRAVCVWHRRSGKDKVMLNYMIKRAYQEVGNYYYMFPFLEQAKKVIWNGIDRDGFAYLDHFPTAIVASINKSDHAIKLKNGSIFQLVGADNFSKGGVGANPRGIIFSEYSIIRPEVWDYIRPILLENHGWAAFIFTPRGRNHGFKLYNTAHKMPDWFCEKLTVKETGLFTDADMEQERAEGMSESMIKQEYYCDFDTEAEGALFKRDMIERNRVEGWNHDLTFERVVMYIDPAGSAKAKSDETGVAIAGLGIDGIKYLMFSNGYRLSPNGWANEVIKLFYKYQVDIIYYESNYGGLMAKDIIKSIDPVPPVMEIHSKHGKKVRAEPVATECERDKLRFVGRFPQLEDQLCTCVLPGEESTELDDRYDAFCGAMTALNKGRSAAMEPLGRLI